MIRNFAKTMMGAAMAAAGSLAMAQDPPPPIGWSICIDPNNTAPYSNDYGINTKANELARCTIGGGGTATYGSATGPCFSPAYTRNSRGRIGFASGPSGSAQSGFDDDLQYTFGMPTEPMGAASYVNILTRPAATPTATPASTLFGGNAFSLFFAGFSDRYMKVQTTVDNVFIDLSADVIGDCTRLRWQMTNLATDARQIGLWYGAVCGLITNNFDTAGALGPPAYMVVPGRKPIVVDTRLTRAQDPANFPPYIQMVFGQTNAYGLHVDMGPTPATSDNNGLNSDATSVDEVVIGDAFFLLGWPSSNDVNRMPDFVFGDISFADTAFIMKYEPNSSFAQNQTRQIVSYYRSSWGNPRYTRPYTTVADAPKVLVTDESGLGTNGYENNPFPIRVWIDNVRGYTGAGTEFQMDDVKVTLTLPTGLTLAPGETAQKTISRINPKQLAFVEWMVEADGIEVGDLTYSVKVDPIPQQIVNLSGTIRTSLTKQIRVEPAANLLASPWVYPDSSWSAIFGLSQPLDFTAYDWDPQQQSYVISTSAARGKGTWIVMNPNTHPTTEILPFNNAQTPPDTTTGTANLQLKSGWNLIGNPYQYAVPVGQLVGVSASNPSQSYRFADLVAQGIVTPYLAYYDPIAGNYRFVQGVDAVLHPGRGYWIKVQTSQDLTLNFPPVYQTFIPGGRSVTPSSSRDYDWRLNVQAKSIRGSDPENYFGVSRVPAALQILEPPQGPVQDVTVSFAGTVAGRPAALAQAINPSANQEWRMTVKSQTGGNVTLSWPGVATVPPTVKLRLTDMRTGQIIDMRQKTTVTFAATANSVREFKIQALGAVSTTIK